VFISFRTFIPSIAVISAALTDILASLVVINLLNIKLSAAGVVAFLLVIGYSIDTDILLTTRLLKRREEGNLYERLKHSITTGLTMTIAAIAALTTGYFIAISEQLKQIFLVIIIALVFDIISTYFGNAGILIWYMKKKNIT
ncbi:MAG: protein translocase subunit SecF, partial [Nanoarchaeota archaeon]